MRIDALVVCVGQHYADTLAQALPVWLDTLDSLVVVTNDVKNITLKRDYWTTCKFTSFTTDIFYRYGAHFNKGAALSEAFYHLNPQDWVLNIDADIIPPKDWRKIAEPLLEVGNLYGCKRHYENTTNHLESDSTFPDLWGYFHLWNVRDSASWIRPVYPVDCGHAGNYDHTFMRRWTEDRRRELPFTVRHIGPPRNNWFGQGNGSQKRMDELHELGLYNAWYTKAGHIKVPEPKWSQVFDNCSHSCEEAAWLLRKWSKPDPFSYTVRVK
jgi:hypothetical protein